MRLVIAMVLSLLIWWLFAYGLLDSATTGWLIVTTMVAGIGPMRVLKLFFGIWLLIRAFGG
jgi:hypothetical protein